MEWVVEVVQDVLNHWHGPAVDVELTLLTAHLHDLGNIVKFRRPFTGKIATQLLDNLDHWYSVQDQFIAKYGTDANQATHKILVELHLEQSVGKVLRQMEQLTNNTSGQPIFADEQIGLEARIIEYGDSCVSPAGIVGFEARLRDLFTRYGHHADEPWTQILRKNAQIVESLSRF